MTTPSRRVVVLALAFLVATCGTQALAPRGEAPPRAPSASSSAPSATSIPQTPNASNDIVYVRQSALSPRRIVAVDARTGEWLRAMPDGAVSADRTVVYSTEPVNGAARTQVRVSDLETGLELRTFIVDADVKPLGDEGGSRGLSADARWLTLSSTPYKTLRNDGTWVWVSQFAVTDTISGVAHARIDLSSTSTYLFVGLSRNGRSAYLDEFDGSATRTRIYDVARALRPGNVPGTEQPTGYKVPAIESPDGRWLYSLNASPDAAPFLLALDLDGSGARRVTLPADQAADWKKALLWSLVQTPDGAAIYVVNPALGVANEIDARQLTLRRTGRIAIARVADTPISAMARAFLPVAEAKRYIMGGAVLSPDGGTIYAVGDRGVAVIDAARLESRATWQSVTVFGSLALSPDGARLYAMVEDDTRTLAIISTVEGSRVGTIRASSYADAVLRIDLRRARGYSLRGTESSVPPTTAV